MAFLQLIIQGPRLLIFCCSVTFKECWFSRYTLVNFKGVDAQGNLVPWDTLFPGYQTHPADVTKIYVRSPPYPFRMDHFYRPGLEVVSISSAHIPVSGSQTCGLLSRGRGWEVKCSCVPRNKGNHCSEQLSLLPFSLGRIQKLENMTEPPWKTIQQCPLERSFTKSPTDPFQFLPKNVK